MSGTPARPALLRALNDVALLALLSERGPLTRAELASSSELSKPTVAESLARLEAADFITQTGESAGRPGPNGRLWGVRPNLANSAAVRVSPSQFAIVLSDVRGNELASVSERRSDSKRSPADVVGSLLRQVCAAAKVPMRSVATVLVGVPGTYDVRKDVITLVDRIPEWTTLNVNASLEKALGVPVVIENDANLALVAERRIGAATEPGTTAYLWLGSGLGLAFDLVEAAGPYRGAHGQAGEVGYLPVPLPTDTTGITGNKRPIDLQDLIGGPAIVRLANAYGFAGRDPAVLVERALTSTTAAAKSFTAALAERITLGIAPIAAVVDPDLVVLGGPVGRAGGEPLVRAVRRQVATLRAFRPHIIGTEVAADPVLTGGQLVAVDRAREQIFTTVTTDATDAALVSGLLLRP